MADKDVKIVLSADAKAVIGELKKTEAALNDIKGGLPSMRGQFEGLKVSTNGLLAGFMSLQAALGIFSVLKEKVKESLDYLGKLETATLGIATAFAAGGSYIDKATGKVLEGQEALAAGQAEARRTLEQLQVVNMQTIATLEQLVRAYQETLPVALAKGFNKQQVVDFTTAMVQAAGAIGLSMEQLGEETRSILTASVNPRTSRIATVLGLTNEDIRKVQGDTNKFFAFLMEKLAAYRTAGIESQKTWAGLTSNMKDIMLQAGGKALEPLFIVLKQSLSEIIDSLVTIDEKTKTISWNKDFTATIDAIRNGITATAAEITRMAMLLDKVGGTLTSIIPLFAKIMNYTLFLGQFKGLEDNALVNTMKEWNTMYEERYKAGDVRLMDLSMATQGFKPATEMQKQMLDWQTPESLGLVRVTTELGEVLYYYKEIGKAREAAFKQPPKPQTEEQKKALDDWAKTLRGLGTEIDKTLPPVLRMKPTFDTDEAADKIADIDKKYQDLLKKASQSAKEHGVALDTSVVEKWRTAMIAEVRYQEQWAAYEEGLKRREEAERTYGDVVRAVNDELRSDLDNRIQAAIDDETKLTRDLFTVWSSGAITYRQYQDDLARIEEAGAKKRRRIVEDAEKTRRESELQTLMAVTELQEKQGAISRETSVRRQVTYTEELLVIQERYLTTIDRLKDPEGWNAQQRAILDTQAKIVDLRSTLQIYTGGFGEGMALGIRDTLNQLQTTFQAGKTLAEDTAKAMQSAFQEFFFDAFQGELKTLNDYLTSFAKAVQKTIADLLSQQMTKGILTGLQGLFPSLVPRPAMASLEEEREAYFAAQAPATAPAAQAATIAQEAAATIASQAAAAESVTAAVTAQIPQQTALTAEMAAQIPVIAALTEAYHALAAAMEAVGLGGGSIPGINGGWEGITDLAVISGPAFHGGGVAGLPGEGSAPRPRLQIVPRFHTGIGPDEIPAILQRGEGVFTQGQMRALGLTAMAAQSGPQRPPNVTINVKNEAGKDTKADIANVRFDGTDIIVDAVIRKLGSDPAFRRKLNAPGDVW